MKELNAIFNTGTVANNWNGVDCIQDHWNTFDNQDHSKILAILE